VKELAMGARNATSRLIIAGKKRNLPANNFEIFADRSNHTAIHTALGCDIIATGNF
jgi:hypothetical protein